MKLFQSKILEEDFPLITEILSNGQLGFGSNVGEFERQFGFYSQKKENVAVNSASAASFLIFAYLKDLHGSCNVYTTSLGFASPAWSARHFGHSVFFVDTDNSLLMSSESYKECRKHVGDKKKTVVMPVLYAGVSTLNDWSLVGDEIVVVDSAHCVTPNVDSDITFFSFHPYKPVCSSDGGMIATDDLAAAEYFQSYRNFGRQNKGHTYDITQDGFKFYMNNLNATMALISLSHYREDLMSRQANFEIIQSRCPDVCFYPHDSNSSYYFAAGLHEEADRIMGELGIQRNYPLLHQTTYYNQVATLLNIESKFDSILNIPIHQCLTNDEIKTIIKTLGGT